MEYVNKRAIFMACSKTKRRVRSATALDLYCNSSWVTLNSGLNALREARTPARVPPAVIVLSSLHGFISGYTVIEPYEEILTVERGRAIVADGGHRFRLTTMTEGIDEILLAGGKLYRQVMADGLDAIGFKGIGIVPKPRGIGDINHQIARYVAESPYRFPIP